MRWEVEFTPPAPRSLKKLDRPVRDLIAAGIHRLAEELERGINQPTGATKLVGMDAFRLRVGDYRVVFRAERRMVRGEPEVEADDEPGETIACLIIERIGHRREVYRP